MNLLLEHLKQGPLVYVTRDLERALGLDIDTPGYFIIANVTPFAKELVKAKNNVLLIDAPTPLDTRQLLEHPATKTYLQTLPKPNLLVFKPTKQIEEICAREGWYLLNPASSLGNQIEEKITQLAFLPEIRNLFPQYKIRLCEQIKWADEPFVLQFNHSHTGSGTVLIDKPEILAEIKQKFPRREARVARYIVGPLFTSNCVVTPNKTLLGNISYQITGLPPFTARSFATIGNDWGLAKKLLSEEQCEQYRIICECVGTALRARCWRGLFGIDVILDEKTGKLYLLEINARQPASATYESLLQRQRSEVRSLKSKITIVQAHLMSLLDLPLDGYSLVPIADGAQIILRNTGQIHPKDCAEIKQILMSENLSVMPYNNSALEAELLRIQSKTSLMSDHNQLNVIGKKIQACILPYVRPKAIR